MKKPPADPCPCDPTRSYAQCCGRLHAGVAADDAAALMRSRYSAYVRRLPDYLLATWHPDTRPAQLDLADGPDGRLQWLGLSVQEHRRSGPDHAHVRFVARFREGGQPARRLRELSRFVHEDGRWFYLDGEVD